MQLHVLVAALVLTSALATSGFSQTFQPRTARISGSESAAAATSVSRDLLQLYGQTKSASTEAAVTSIARACTKVLQDGARTEVDRNYAASLFAWALNRRGEIRSELAASLVEQGQAAEATKMDSLAADDFETALEYAPDNWRTCHNYAISLAMKGDYQQAIAKLTRAIELKPEYANAYFNRGELHFELQQFESALADYSAAVRLNEQDPQYFNSRGHCRFMLEAYEEALTDYRQAAQLASDSAVYQTDLADAYQFLGRWKEAASAYRSAVAINNKFPRAYQNAAWLMATCPEAEFRNAELALSAARKAIEMGSGRTATSLDTLAAATAAAGKIREAAALQRQAVDMSTDDAERLEMVQRLKLYEQGQSYVQPQRLAAGKQTSAIRTASGSEASSSRR